MSRLPLLFFLFLCLSVTIPAAAGPGPYYHWSASRLFWFMVISDTHIGTSGSQDTDYLEWAVTEARQAIDPLFIVNAGDLTDSTDGGLIPNGPYQDEWDEYRGILEQAGIDASFYYDIPGNHDAYNDADFTYYLSNSIQGQAEGTCQHSWSREFNFGAYHFLAVNTAGNDGASFSIWPWDNYGDNAGLDAVELAFIESDLSLHPESSLTLIFGHHPMDAGYTSFTDTGLTYGRSQFLDLVDQYGVSFYGFGHTHKYSENFYYDDLEQGVLYINFASLGKSDHNHYAVMAVDGNGLSVVPAEAETWPLVVITAPVDQALGDDPNPMAYAIPAGNANPVRALVFDSAPVSRVQYRIDDSGDWHDMHQEGTGPVWKGFWDAFDAPAGFHTITVRATGTETASDSIRTLVNPSLFMGDSDRDGDVDGKDLAAFAKDFEPEVVIDIAGSYGRGD